MKDFLKLFIAILCLSSCNSPSEKPKETQTINVNEIRQHEIVHEELTQDQLAKIKKIYTVFHEVEKASLEETITDFKRDVYPDNEIAIWLTMADAYQNYLKSKNDELDLETKTEVYRLILSRSMMSDEEVIKNSDLTKLSINEAKKVLSFYKAKPNPIDVVKEYH